MKDFLRNWLFKKEIDALYERSKALDEKERLVVQKEDDFDEASDALDEVKANMNVVDLVRANLKSFNPRLLDSEDDVLAVIIEEGEDGADAFLAAMHELHLNTSLWRLAEFIERNLVLHAAKEAVGIDDINFARASLNGVGLLREEVERLDTVYLEKHAKEPEFDEFEAL